MDRLRDIVLFMAGVIAIVSMILALYEGFNQRVIAAGFLGTLFLVSTFIVFLPKLEIFEAWGVKAQLTKKLGEADQILAKLRELSLIHAKAVYMHVGAGQRLDGSSAKEKQAILDEVDKQLRELNVSEEERRTLAANYVRLMGFDFYMMYVRTLERYFDFKHQAMVGDLGKNSGDAELKSELDRWRKGRETWKPNYNLFSQIAVYSFEDEIGRITPSGWLSDREQRAVDAYRNQVISLHKAIQAKGGLTKEAADYYDRYHDLGGQDQKIKELFNFNPSELR